MLLSRGLALLVALLVVGTVGLVQAYLINPDIVIWSRGTEVSDAITNLEQHIAAALRTNTREYKLSGTDQLLDNTDLDSTRPFWCYTGSPNPEAVAPRQFFEQLEREGRFSKS